MCDPSNWLNKVRNKLKKIPKLSPDAPAIDALKDLGAMEMAYGYLAKLAGKANVSVAKVTVRLLVGGHTFAIKNTKNQKNLDIVVAGKRPYACTAGEYNEGGELKIAAGVARNWDLRNPQVQERALEIAAGSEIFTTNLNEWANDPQAMLAPMAARAELGGMEGYDPPEG